MTRALLERGARVRAIVRSKTPHWLPGEVEQAVADLNRVETLKPHLAGITAAFLLSGYGGLEQSLAEMREVGVKRVVLLSSSAAPSGDLSNAVARYHVLAERAVEASGIPWVFLQPNSFMSNASRWLPQLATGDLVRLPFAGVRVAAIDPGDLGAAAAAVLTEGGHEGHRYRLSGPESLLPEQQVQIVASALGRSVCFEPQGDDEARREMSRGMPKEYVDAFFEFFAAGALDESEVLPTVERLTGRPPRTFARWVAAHVEELRPLTASGPTSNQAEGIRKREE